MSVKNRLIVANNESNGKGLPPSPNYSTTMAKGSTLPNEFVIPTPTILPGMSAYQRRYARGSVKPVSNKRS